MKGNIMKRIITTLLSCLIIVGFAHADSIRVPTVWGFAVGSTQGNYIRAILDHANQEQKKYQFQFEHKPGAGGSIATRTAQDTTDPVLLAHTAAFYVRPNLYPETTYRFYQFRPILVMGTAPAVLMTKGKTLDQLLKQPRITIGTAGAGSSSHLIAEILKKYIKGSEVNMIHFKDTNEAYLNVLGGHIDANFEFLGDATARATPEVVFAGLTGNVSINNIPLLRDRDMPDMAQANNIFAIYVNASMPEQVYNELRNILLKAEQSEKVKQLYVRDFTYRDHRLSQTNNLQPWYDHNVQKFRQLTTGIKVE
jgi:tripartite-type tricarboxylate transporter receptor subunit TctC